MQQNKLPVFWTEKITSDGVPIEVDEEESGITVTLIALGDTAKPKQPVVVQMQWKNDEEDEESQQTVLCTLEKGRVDQCAVDLKLFDSVQIKHNGGKDVVVYMNGVQYFDVSNMADMDLDDEDEGQQTTIKQIPDNLQKQSLNGQNAKKQAADSEEDEVTDEDEEEEKTPKLIELKVKDKKPKTDSKAKAEETPKSVGGEQKKSKKKLEQVTEKSAKEEKSQQGKEKDAKKRKADGGADKGDQVAKKKAKEEANAVSTGSADAQETFKAAIVNFLKGQGGKAQLGDIGTNVKKPKDLPKSMKLRKIILNNSDTFNLDVADSMVTLK
eukprot:TRINITY_DN2780_c0_g1_i2.p1 TRINITY_DN2780_c0_g1~~TRINITY_DN2780_c0_g1_i2.p1  ORF type:complete len:356 (+),score=82.52 TRINITY_DN2780_c0_g1_i2:92-1069(+)